MSGPNRFPAHANHSEGLFLQPLPACLAATEEERAALPDMPMPHPGDLVVLDTGYVHFLQPLDDTRPLTEANSFVMGVGMYGPSSCQGTWWDENSIQSFDPDLEGLEEGDPEAIRESWRLLLDHANATGV